VWTSSTSTGGRVVLDPPGGLLASDAENLVVSEETVGRTADADDRSGPDRGEDDV
jgi:16S rRNA processing protein RimM